MDKELHPAVTHVLQYFTYEHLQNEYFTYEHLQNEFLRNISKAFANLAHDLVELRELNGPELTVALRKLLEAKDAAVRAAL